MPSYRIKIFDRKCWFLTGSVDLFLFFSPKIITRKKFDLIEIVCLFTWLSKAKTIIGPKGARRLGFSAELLSQELSVSSCWYLIVFSVSQLSYQAKRHFLFFHFFTTKKKYIYISEEFYTGVILKLCVLTINRWVKDISSRARIITRHV